MVLDLGPWRRLVGIFRTSAQGGWNIWALSAGWVEYLGPQRRVGGRFGLSAPGWVEYLSPRRRVGGIFGVD